VKLFTKEWVESMAETLKNDSDFQKKAEGFDSKFQFVALSDPESTCRNVMKCGR